MFTAKPVYRKSYIALQYVVFFRAKYQTFHNAPIQRSLLAFRYQDHSIACETFYILKH